MILLLNLQSKIISNFSILIVEQQALKKVATMAHCPAISLVYGLICAKSWTFKVVAWLLLLCAFDVMPGNGLLQKKEEKEACTHTFFLVFSRERRSNTLDESTTLFSQLITTSTCLEKPWSKMRPYTIIFYSFQTAHKENIASKSNISISIF